MRHQTHFHDPQNLHISVHEESRGDNKWVRITITDGSGDAQELIMYNTTWGTIRSLLHFAGDNNHHKEGEGLDEYHSVPTSVIAQLNKEMK